LSEESLQLEIGCKLTTEDKAISLKVHETAGDIVVRAGLKF